MSISRGVVYSVLFLTASCLADSDFAELEEKHQQSIASEDGKAFEMNAVQAFWGDAAFMQKCVPPDVDSPEPLVIYFEVTPDGSLGELVISPQNDVATCISEAVSERRFPNPPHEWIGKIVLSFTD